MSDNPDYVISQPGQPFKGAVVIIESIIGSRFFQENELCILKAIFSSSNMGKERERMIKNKQEYLEEVIFKRSVKTTKDIISPDATDEEKKAHRRRVLNAKTTRWRGVFFPWPRDPNGKVITAENSALGKMAPNYVQLWGATLFDFYHVKRFPGPDAANMITYSSGSKLAAWMKENGEDYAKDQLQFAEIEEDPHIILPYEITELIQDGDVFGVGDRSWIRDERDDEGSDESIDRKVKSNGEEKGREDWQVPGPWPPASPFDPIAYPKPWPIEPFATNYPKLEKYIIHSHLPKILKVHDPWNLLPAPTVHTREWTKEKEKRWSDKTDVVHTYRLKTSTKYTARKTQDDKLAEEEKAKKQAIYDTFIGDPHSRHELPIGILFEKEDERHPGPVQPPIFIALPLQPPIPPAREAHLYLSSRSIGEGGHSFVYSAEFELPRSTIMNDQICHQCIMEDAHRTLIEEDGPNGERRDPKWDEKAGRYVAKQAGKPSLVMEGEPGETEYVIEPSTLQTTLEYEGPYRLIQSKIGYQSLERGPYCEHIATSPNGIHPLTAKVKVAAKLSIRHDYHLSREAEKYQAFPRHFFEHWSGFNLIKSLNEPTPVGPLVPQFYGYYVPDEQSEQSDSNKSQSGSPEPRPYISPILLIEDCGKQLDPDNLTLDDKSEVAALVFRFHEAGWIHGSVYRRNILVQPGPLSDYPLCRLLNTGARGGRGVNWSFRLIDFGRSYEIYDRPEGEREKLIMEDEEEIQRWLSLKGSLH